MRRALGWVGLAAALAACGEGPTSGELSVRLTSPRNTDRAVLFAITGGAQRGASAPSGSVYRVFADTSAAGDTTWVTVVAPAGTGLATGEIARIAVSDTRRAGAYRASVAEIAASDYSLADTAGVSIQIVKP